jgi:hypothetical protein
MAPFMVICFIVCSPSRSEINPHSSCPPCLLRYDADFIPENKNRNRLGLRLAVTYDVYLVLHCQHTIPLRRYPVVVAVSKPEAKSAGVHSGGIVVYAFSGCQEVAKIIFVSSRRKTVLILTYEQSY